MRDGNVDGTGVESGGAHFIVDAYELSGAMTPTNHKQSSSFPNKLGPTSEGIKRINARISVPFFILIYFSTGCHRVHSNDVACINQVTINIITIYTNINPNIKEKEKEAEKRNKLLFTKIKNLG